MRKGILLAFVAIVASNCSGNSLTGAGRDGVFVNDALPPGATLYRAEHDKMGEISEPDGHENFESPLIWNSWKQPVPCSAIKGVDYFRGGFLDGELALKLVGHTYGGQYYPPPRKRNSYWLSPELWVDADFHREKSGDFDETEARLVASHCGVDFRIRY